MTARVLSFLVRSFFVLNDFFFHVISQNSQVLSSDMLNRADYIFPV